VSEQNNRQLLLAQRPTGMVSRENFEFKDTPLASLSEGQVRVQVQYLSLDPAMRGWMNEGKSYIAPVGLGEVMRALGVGQVVESRNEQFKEGDYVSGTLGAQAFFQGNGDELRKIDATASTLPLHLSALGMTGMTAYFALLEVGQPQAGDTVVLSGAAGAVGSIAGQIAKLKGCRVIGIAGGAEKCAYLTDELGFDGVIDYKSEALDEGLKRLCPDGVNVYFDNVGGETLDAVLAQLAFKARVVICGAISQYNSTNVKGPSNYLALLVNRARMEGFIVFDHAQHFAQAGAEMAGWLASGQVKSKEHIVDGLDNFPEALAKLFSGENFGKLMLKV
jgi:NADPH-dependent curcumin reductase CurA